MELRKLFIGVLRLIWITLNNIYSIIPHIILMFFLRPLLWIRPKWYWKIEGIVFNWLMATVANWVWTCGHSIEEMGDDITRLYDDEAIFLSNHLSTGDVPVIMYSLQHHWRASVSSFWIAWIAFKWMPFGLVSQVHGDFFIASGKQTMIELGKYLKGNYTERDRKWIVLFPEGTFLRNGKESSQRFAKKNGYPVLENLVLPRMGAIQTIFDALNGQTGSTKKIKYIIDFTIGYPENKPLDMSNVVFNTLPPRKVSVLYRIYPISEIPLDPDGLQAWTFNMWAEKDKLLDEFYRTGKFPEISESKRCAGVRKLEKRHLVYSNMWMYGLQCVFILSGYIQYLIFCYVLSCVW